MKIVAHGTRRSVAPSADTYDYVTWTRVGPYTVGLRASRVEHIQECTDALPDCPVADLATLLGTSEQDDGGEARLVRVVASRPFALRIPGRVTLTGPTPDALIDLPSFLSKLRTTPGIEALSARGDHFGFVLDLDRIGERVPEARVEGSE